MRLKIILSSMVFLLFVVSSSLLPFCGTCSAGTWYVDDSVSMSGDGTSWQRAFKTIQEGINAASDGNEVVVAQGTYLENIQFGRKNITLTGTDPTNRMVVEATVINGKRAGSVVTFEGTEKETCVLSGFAIRNGWAFSGGGICGGRGDAHTHATIRNNVISANFADGEGGGMTYCDGIIEENDISGNSAMAGGGLSQCNGIIRNNQVASNTADNFGGGVADCGGTIEGNTISGNTAGEEGGGLCFCLGEVRHNTISGNKALYGSGLSYCHGVIQSNVISDNGPTGVASQGGGLYFCSAAISDNTVSRNTAQDGGGLYDCDNLLSGNTINENIASSTGGGLWGCDGTVTGNVVSVNEAQLQGGGLYDCDGLVLGNVVQGNSGGDYGGGLGACDGTIRDNLIAKNWARRGGALWDCAADIESNTIVDNITASRFRGGLEGCTGKIINCIIWRNIWGGGAQIEECSLPAYSCIEAWNGGGEGNIKANPQFADTDYRLSDSSPCLDAGKNEDWMSEATDLDGNPRISQAFKTRTVDMGAYEYPYLVVLITGIRKVTGGKVQITWTSCPGESYEVWSSLALPKAPWTMAATVPSQGTTTSWTDAAVQPRQKFYKVKFRLAASPVRA